MSKNYKRSLIGQNKVIITESDLANLGTIMFYFNFRLTKIVVTTEVSDEKKVVFHEQIT